MARVSFSPYEASLWEWQLSEQDGGQEYLLSPRWSDDKESLPHIVTHKELAKEITSLADRLDWKWNVVEYEAP